MDDIFTYENDRFIIYGACLDKANLKYSLGIRSKNHEFDGLNKMVTNCRGGRNGFDTMLVSDGDIFYNKDDGQYYIFIAPCWYNFSSMAHIKCKKIKYDDVWVKYAAELAKSQYLTLQPLGDSKYIHYMEV